MKIMYIDFSSKGHHKLYLQALLNSDENFEKLLVIPEKFNNLNVEQKIIKDIIRVQTSLFYYLIFLFRISKLCKKNKVDIIHFLYGDSIIKYAGFGLFLLRKYNIIATHHVIHQGSFIDYRLSRFYKKIDYGILHSSTLKQILDKSNILNTRLLQYPYLGNKEVYDKHFSRVELGLPIGKKIIGFIGGTRENKGIDILVESINQLNEQFYFLIAGENIDYDNNYFDKKLTDINYCFFDRYLTDIEVSMSIASSDIIVLPYKNSFLGVSGVLIEAIWNRKFVVGPNHGEIKQIILEYKFGNLFQSENAENLAVVLDKAIKDIQKWDSSYDNYRNKITVELFISSYLKIYELVYHKDK